MPLVKCPLCRHTCGKRRLPLHVVRTHMLEIRRVVEGQDKGKRYLRYTCPCGWAQVAPSDVRDRVAEAIAARHLVVYGGVHVHLLASSLGVD